MVFTLFRLLLQYPKLCSVKVTSTNCGWWRSTCVQEKFYICKSYPAAEVSAASLPATVSGHRHPDRRSTRAHSPGVPSLLGGAAESGRAARSKLCHLRKVLDGLNSIVIMIINLGLKMCRWSLHSDLGQSYVGSCKSRHLYGC